MNERQNQPGQGDIYSDIFMENEDDRPSHRRSTVTAQWDALVNWLRSADRLLWIQGKLGAGKSTLVNFLVQDGGARKALSQWGENPLVISHFFCRVGSIEGFLCSLIFQLLSENHEIVDTLLAERALTRPIFSSTNRSSKQLRKVLAFILERCSRPVCFFIDGLDELLEGPKLDELLSIVNTLRDQTHVKLCLASRAEPAFRYHFSQFLTIKLDQITRPFMHAHVTKILTSCPKKREYDPRFLNEMIVELVQNAEGVFLWLDLVLETIKRGMLKDDGELALRTRLQKARNSLKEHFTDMWKRLGEDELFYRACAARYLKLVSRIEFFQRGLFWETASDRSLTGSWDVSVFQFMLSDEPRVIDSLLGPKTQLSELSVADDCIQTTNKILTRTAGFLEVFGMFAPYEDYAVYGDVSVLSDVSEIRYIHNFGSVMSGSPCPKQLIGEAERIWHGINIYVRFFHATALEYLEAVPEGRRILAFDTRGDDEVVLDIARGILCEMRIRALSREYFVRPHLSREILMHRFIWLLGQILCKASCRQTVLEAERLLRIFEDLFDAGLLPRSRRPGWCSKGSPPAGIYLIWHPAFHRYIIERCRTNKPSYATSILREVLDEFEEFGYLDLPSNFHVHNLIKGLISLGADINCVGICSSSILSFQDTKVARDKMVFAARETPFSQFLKHVINAITQARIHFWVVKSSYALAAFLRASPNLRKRTTFAVEPYACQFLHLNRFYFSPPIDMRNTIIPDTPLGPGFIEDDNYAVALVFRSNLKFLLEECLTVIGHRDASETRHLLRAKRLARSKFAKPKVQIRFFVLYDTPQSDYKEDSHIYRLIRTNIYADLLKMLNIEHMIDMIGDPPSSRASKTAVVKLKRAIYDYVNDPRICERVSPSTLRSAILEETLTPTDAGGREDEAVL